MSDRRPVDRNVQRTARALSKRRPGGYQHALESLLELRDRTRTDVYFNLIARWPDATTHTWLAWGLDEAQEHITNLEHPTAGSSMNTPSRGPRQELTFASQTDRDAYLDTIPNRRAWGSVPGLSLDPDGRSVSVVGDRVWVGDPDPRLADFYADMAAAANSGFRVRMPDGCVVTATPVSRDTAFKLAAETEPWPAEDWADTERWLADRDPDENLRGRCQDAGRDLDEAKAAIRAAWAAGLTNQQIRQRPELADLSLYDSLIDEVCASATAQDIDALPAFNTGTDHLKSDPRCEDCGQNVQPDPDGADGVWVHARELGGRAYDLDADHAARPPEQLS